MLVLPSSRNVVPGEVHFSVEFRHPENAEVDRLDAEFSREAVRIARNCGVSLDLLRLYKIPPQPFDPDCVELVRQAASKLGIEARDIVSGALRDAVQVAGRIPVVMIFTPCKDGLWHNEAESILPSQAEDGCRVLFETVVARRTAPAFVSRASLVSSGS
jgi:N-carbamoyl-L-amino-acid hydrolase